ncbi:MAG: hypothetical protein KDD06_24245 [Phaeodactylibacter sp.]|nr:hypothetical protein [Phaeodactylibacter sp.]MCB9286342.1 hypothetical protein [Lewinellaceae bacterium]
MKNLLLLSLIFLFLSQLSYAQHRRVQKNYIDINAGIGLLPTFVKDAGKVKTPPLSLSADFKLARNFSLGAFAGHSVTETDLRVLRGGGAAKWRNSFSLVGLRMAARSRQMGPWNIYGGMSMAYAYSHIDMMEGQIEKVKEEKGIKESSGRLAFSGFIGGRHSFTPHLGMFGELGFGISLVSFGLSLRI